MKQSNHIFNEADSSEQSAVKSQFQHEHNHGSHRAEMHDHNKDHEKSNNGSGKYYCPMHCEGDKVYDKPGNCPVCNMHLVPVSK